MRANPSDMTQRGQVPACFTSSMIPVDFPVTSGPTALSLLSGGEDFWFVVS